MLDITFSDFANSAKRTCVQRSQKSEKVKFNISPISIRNSYK